MLKRTQRTLVLAAAVAMVAGGMMSSQARAVTYTQTIPNSQTDVWSTGADWNALPVSASTTRLTLDTGYIGTSRTVGTTNDIVGTGTGGAFVLNGMDLNGSNADWIADTVNIAGNALEFQSNGATTPVVNLNAITNAGGHSSFNYNVKNNVILTNNTTFTGAGTGTFSFSGSITGAGSLTKTGSSLLVLSGSVSYAGGTTIAGGTLQLDFSGTNAPTTNFLNAASSPVINGGILSLKGKNSTANSQTFTNGVTINGASGFSIINGNAANSTLLALNTITRATGATVNFTLPNLNSTMSATNGFTTTNTLDASSGLITGIGASGTVGGTDWATLSGTNIVAYTAYTTLSGASPNIVDGSTTNVRVTSTSSAAVGQTAGTVTVNSLLINDATARTITIGSGNTLRLGAIGGILAPTGTGAVTIGAAGNAGTLTAGGANNTAGEIVLNHAVNMTVNSVIANNGSGVVSLTKSGIGTLTLNSANTYTGTTTINGGTLLLGNKNALGPNTGAGALVINSGTIGGAGITSSSNNPMTWNNSFNVAFLSSGLNMGTGAVTMNNDITLTTANNYSAAFTVGGAIGDGGHNYGLTIAGGSGNNGTVILTGNNSFGGGVTLASSGSLQIGSSTALGTGTFTILGGAIANASNITVGNNLIFSGNGYFTGLNPMTFSGPVTLTGNRTITTQNKNGNILAFSNVISDGGGNYGLTYAGSTYGGVLALNAANTFTGGVTLVPGTDGYGYYLNIGNLAALGSGTFTLNGGTTYQVAFDNTTGADGTLSTNNAQVWKNLFTFKGTNSLDMGTGSVTLGANVTATVTAKTLTIGGAIGDGGTPYTLTKAGAGTLTLAGANTFGGVTTISAGILQLNHSLALQNSTISMPATSTSLVFNAGIGSFTFGGITGSASHTLADNSGAGITLRVGNNNSSTAYSGVLSDGTGGAGALTKVGTGTLTLTGIHTYTGPTAVQNGTLLLTSPGSLAAGSTVTVGHASTAGLTPTLTGTGTINGNLTVLGNSAGSAGQLTPGTSTGGTLTVGGSTVTVNSGSVLNYYFGNTAPNLLALTSPSLNLTLASSGLVLNNVNSYPFSGTGSVQLMSFLGSTSVSNFNNSPGYVLGGAGANLGSVVLGSGFSDAEKYALTSTSTGIFLSYKPASSSNAAFFSVAVASSAAMLHTSDLATLTTTLTNTGTTADGNDSLVYSNLTSAVSPTSGSSLTGTPISGTLATNADGTAQVVATQTFTATTAGSYNFTVSGNITGLTTTATGSVTGTTVNVFSGNATWQTAASGSWGSGASGDWNDNTNATIHAAPGTFANFTNTDSATFATIAGATSPLTVSLDGANPSLNSLTLNSATLRYIIAQGSGGTLTLSGTGATINVTGNHTISAPVVLASSTTVTANSGSSLLLSGPISDNGTANSLTFNGLGTLTLTGASTYTGTTSLNGGTLVLGNPSAMGTSTLVINSGTINSNNANYTTFTLTANNPMTWNGSFTAGNYINGLNMGTGAVTLGNNVTITTQGGGYGTLFTVGGAIGDGGHNFGLTIASTGANPNTVNLAGHNTFSGGVTLAASGSLQIGSNNALGTGVFTINGGGLTQTNGTILTGVSSIIINGNLGIGATNGAVNLGTAPVTLVGARSISVNNGNATIGGPISGVGASLTLLGTPYGSSMNLGGDNTFDGGVTVAPGTATFTLSLGTATSLGSGALTLSPGSGGSIVVNNGAPAGTIWTNNNTQAWNTNFTITGNSLNMGTGAVTLGTAPGSSRTITTGANTYTIDGVISDGTTANALVKAGTGTLVLNAANTFTGGIVVNAGTLLVGNASALGNGGPLALTGTAVVSMTASEFSSAVQIGRLTMPTTAKIDLGTNDLIIQSDATNLDADYAATFALLQNARNTGATNTWTGTGITSSLATHVAKTTGLDLKGLALAKDATTNSLKIKYTYVGDTDLDGTITMDDYLAIDTGYLFNGTGYAAGDFDYSGTIDAKDYALIDNSFVNKNGVLGQEMINLHASWFGAEYLDAFNALAAPVPEPASLLLLGVGALSLLKRRR